jgi:hypothetical protein
VFALLSVALFSALPAAANAQPPQTSHDGLELQPNTKAGLVYLKPGADFSVYDKVALLDCEVTFKESWQREQNRANGVAAAKKEMDDLGAALAKRCAEIFKDELETKGGYQFVDTAALDVLLLVPALIDVHMSVDTGRRQMVSTSAGEMTLVIEMYDSSTREILGRVADRQAGRYTGMMWHTEATDRHEADLILRAWAAALRERLDTLRAAGKTQ